MVSMNLKNGNICVGNINLRKPNPFLFLNFFFVFILLKVRSSRSFLDFLGIFSYKYEIYKYIFCTEITKGLFDEIPISISYQISELLSVQVGALFVQENLC